MTAPRVPEPPVPAAPADGRDTRFDASALLSWFGGGGSEVADRHERGGYAVGGVAVLLFAVLSAVTVAAATVAAHWPPLIVALAVLIVLPLFAFGARALATATPQHRGRGDLSGRITVAVLAGVVVAELASTVLLAGTVHRELDERARHDGESAPAVVTARTELEQARSERAGLDQAVAKAQGDIEQSLVIARCEFHPTPECPQTKITGVPGRGPEAQTAEDMLADARARLAAAQARVQPLDDRIADRQQALDRARADAFDTGDRGLGARWLAMHDYTTGHAGGLLLRLATILVAVVLALLPLLLRWWRGETSFERGIAARAVADRADRQAEAAIAVKRAEVRTEAETLRAEQELAAARLAAHADTAIDREQQRRRILAAIGNFEIGVTEPARRAVADFESLAALPAAASTGPAPQEGNVTPSRDLPAQRTSDTLASSSGAQTSGKSRGGLELPVIGTVPFSDTAARWIRPLVPSFVTSAVDTATHPLRTVRQVFEEAEEITFTLRRTRKVTVHSDEPDSSGYAPGTPRYAQQVANDVVDTHDLGHTAMSPASPEYHLGGAGRRDAVSSRPGDPELDYQGLRQLPPASGKD
ncbi:DUF4407 domain-containing protein [Nocardia wallacei]|uniref:DUF4407 domain-containing protein n=1 Tax=Nocardia wallacei TaxID=480035 RepID=UPI002457CE58|nr:DUF4407 domain-containing protein [Nocardia wallacei]